MCIAMSQYVRQVPASVPFIQAYSTALLDRCSYTAFSARKSLEIDIIEQQSKLLFSVCSCEALACPAVLEASHKSAC